MNAASAACTAGASIAPTAAAIRPAACAPACAPHPTVGCRTSGKQHEGFSGSYHPDDVQFLVKQIELEPMADLRQKERLIQSGARHYSEVLSPESLPSDRYLQVYRNAYAANLPQMARDCLALAALIAARRDGPVTLVSLLRAGTPVGVVLKHVLEQVFQRPTSHYSLSIIRDRGIDQVAMRHILQRHTDSSIVFVDGWTGKGVISRELDGAVRDFNLHHGCAVDPGLFVLSDLAGSAACAASCDDYLIPSSILNSTVSGLVSRSVLNGQIGPGDFHGCVYYTQFAPHDQSRQFAEGVVRAATDLAARVGLPDACPVDRQQAACVSRRFIEAACLRFGITDVNLIKPGIGEATRVLLRRVPERLILRAQHLPQVAHLLVLAEEKGVPVTIDPDLPYQAVSLIRSASDA